MRPEINYVKLPLGSAYSRRNAEREAFLPCRLTQEGLVEPVGYHGSAHLQALLQCDGFFVVPKDVREVAAGERVAYLSIKGSFE